MERVKPLLDFMAKIPRMMGMCGMSGEDLSTVQAVRMAILEWAKYKKLEEQSLLLKLPCKVGDTVYEVQEIRKRIQPYTIISVHISNCSILFGWELKDGKGIYSNVNGFCDYAIGKTVFLTQAEAEEVLQEMEAVG